MRRLGVLTCLTACSFTPGRLAGDAQVVVDDVVDAPDDAPGIDASPLGPFGNVTQVTALLSAAQDSDASLTADMLEIYWRSNRANGIGGDDIWMATWDSIANDWGTPTNITAVNSAGSEREPAVSANGLVLRWSLNNDIYQSIRNDRLSPWTGPTKVPELDGYYDAHDDASGLRVVGSGTQTGNEQLYIATRQQVSDPFGTPQLITELNTSNIESGPYLFDGGRQICYDAYYGNSPHRELYVARRASVTEPFVTYQPISELNSSAWDSDCWISADQRTIYFASERDGNRRIYVATR